MDDLILFMRARLDDDEVIARNAEDMNAADWYLGQAEDDGERSILYEADSTLQPGRPAEYHLADRVEVRAAVHIGRHDPARVLRDVAAKRAIIATHDPARHPQDSPDVRWCPVCITGRDGYAEEWSDDRYPCLTLRQAAAVYSNHPDYDPAWKLEA